MTPKDELHENLVTPLTMYHSLLGQSVHLPALKADETPPILWFKTRSRERITRKTLSALELLVWLAHVDWNVWKQQAQQIWDCRPVDFSVKPARVGVNLNPYMEGRVEPVFEMLATSVQSAAEPTDIAKAREWAMSILRGRGNELSEIPVRIDGCTSGTFKVMQLVVTHKNLYDLDTHFGGDVVQSQQRFQGFRVRVFCPFIRKAGIAATELQHLAAISAAGVAIEDLGAIRSEVYTHRPVTFTRCQWVLYAIGATDKLERQRGVKHVALTRVIHLGMIGSIYSAVGASPSVRSMEIDPTSNGRSPIKYRQQVWRWIAYTLFCGAPNSSLVLEELTVNVKSVRMTDIVLVHEVLTARDPISKLFSRADTQAAEAISASRFRLRNPSKQGGADVFVVDSPHVLHDLPVLKKSKEWTIVLLPAWGQAWVHRDDVLTEQRWAGGPYPVKSISRIEFCNLRNESKDAVMALVRLVRPRVKHLVFVREYRLNGSCFDDWLNQVIRICPNLEMLEIDGFQLHSLEFLIDGYTSGKCRLTRFKAKGVRIVTERESLRQISVALGDRSHPAARYMSEFECSPLSFATMVDPIMAATTTGMLEKNDRLRDFELGFLWRETFSNDRFSEYTERLKAYDKMTISHAFAPLDVRRRVAFLSVVTPRQAQKNRSNCRPHVIETLDACVLSLIFEMAATCCKRRVHIAGNHSDNFI